MKDKNGKHDVDAWKAIWADDGGTVPNEAQETSDAGSDDASSDDLAGLLIDMLNCVKLMEKESRHRDEVLRAKANELVRQVNALTEFCDTVEANLRDDNDRINGLTKSVFSLSGIIRGMSEQIDDLTPAKKSRK